MRLTRITDENRGAFLPFLFGAAQTPSPTLLQLGILDDRGNVAGALAAETGRSHVEILSLYVVPVLRKKGYGSLLISQLTGLTDPEHYSAMSVAYSGDAGISRFFERQGFEVFPSSGQYSFTVGEFLRSSTCQRYIVEKEPEGIKRISMLTEQEKGEVHKYLAKSLLPVSGWFDRDWSTIRLQGGQIASIMLTSTDNMGLSLIWLYSRQPTPNEPIQHMRALWEKMDEVYPQEKSLKIRFVAENTKMLDFTSSLLGGVQHLDWESQVYQAIRLV